MQPYTQLTLHLKLGLCHASYCVLYIVGCLCCFSLAVASMWGPLPGCPRAFGCCRVNTCGSQGLPLPGVCTHNITFPSLRFVIQRRNKHQELQHVKQLFPLQISITSSAKFTWNSSEKRTSRKMELEMPYKAPVLTLLMEI